MSTESTPRERLARILSLLRRARTYWLSAGTIALLGVVASFALALHTKRVWRSETTVLYRDAINTNRDGESVSSRAARLGPKLKDLLEARPRLSAVITEFDLYPQKAQRSMVEAVEEMQSHVTFRARNSDTYVIGFDHEDPGVAQRVTARLAEIMITDYSRESVDSATMTRDFLRRELEEANSDAEKASRSLAVFLAQNPEFQWGVNENPYAAPSTPGAPLARPREGRLSAPTDPQLASLEAALARVDAELAPRAAPGTAALDPSAVLKRREAAATALAAAEAALLEKLQSVTAEHPDAVAARGRVDAARRALASAEADVALGRAAAGAAAAAPVEGGAGLAPARRDELQKERTSLIGKIAARRGELRGERPAAEPEKKEGSKPLARPAKRDAVELETDWHRLRLELDRARDHFRGVELKARAADMLADAAERKTQSEMQILDPAYRPTRAEKGRGRVFFAGTIIALFFAFAFAGARVLLDDRLHDEGDVIALGGPPVLVTLPPWPAPPSMPPRDVVRVVERAPAGAAPAAREWWHDGLDSGADPGPAWGGARAADPGRPVRARKGHATPRPSGPAARAGANTVRWGTGAEAVLVNQVFDASTALAPVPRAQELAAVRARPIIEAILDEPEVEVIGADTGSGPDGALGLLRSTSPQTMAALRVLRHRLEQRRGEAHLVVGVVSPGEAEGKTTLAIRLALTLSEAERARVVLVEGHLDRPGLAAALGLTIPDEAGFSAQIQDRLAGRVGAWGVVRLTPSLTLLAEPGPEAAYPEALHSTHFDAALRTLQRNYDYVIIDGPAVVGSGDANVIENASDALLLVLRAGVTPGAALAEAVDQLGDRRVLGVVLGGVAQARKQARRRRR